MACKVGLEQYCVADGCLTVHSWYCYKRRSTANTDLEQPSIDHSSAAYTLLYRARTTHCGDSADHWMLARCGQVEWRVGARNGQRCCCEGKADGHRPSVRSPALFRSAGPHRWLHCIIRVWRVHATITAMTRFSISLSGVSASTNTHHCLRFVSLMTDTWRVKRCIIIIIIIC